MQFIERISYKSKALEIKLDTTLLCAEWQLDFDTIANYKQYKDLTVEKIKEYNNPPKSFRCLRNDGDVFEESVRCLTKIEDKTGFEIDHIVIPFNYTTDRVNLCEFYRDSKEISLECHQASEIIKAISFIEYNRYNTVNIAYASAGDNNKWIYDRDLFYAVKEYIGAICSYDKYMIGTLTDYNFTGKYII